MTKNTNTSKATRAVYTILRQISTLVPREFASFAVVEDAAHHDSKRAGVCTGQLVQGDILVADRAYLGTSGVGSLEIAGTDPKNLSVFAIFGFCEASASVAAHERRGGRKRGDFSMVLRGCRV